MNWGVKFGIQYNASWIEILGCKVQTCVCWQSQLSAACSGGRIVSYRGLFTADWFGVREKYCSRLEIYDRLRASEQAADPIMLLGLDFWLVSLLYKKYLALDLASLLWPCIASSCRVYKLEYAWSLVCLSSLKFEKSKSRYMLWFAMFIIPYQFLMHISAFQIQGSWFSNST